jgi:hypothetical protein
MVNAKRSDSGLLKRPAHGVRIPAIRATPSTVSAAVAVHAIAGTVAAGANQFSFPAYAMQ